MMPAHQEFTLYGPSHWAMIALFVAGSAGLIWLGRRQNEHQARTFGRVVGALTGLIYAAVLVYMVLDPEVTDAIPLRLTDIATVVAAVAWWSQRHWAFAITYYWGLVLSAQALVSPVLHGPDFPSVEYLAFWAIHLLVVWAAVYLTWGRGMRPTWRSYRLVVGVTMAWALLTFLANTMTGANYGFLNEKPSTATLLDVLGPWPVYIFAAAALVLVVWALMTWPWQRARRRPVASGSPLI
ncbi:TIGR02206 family membrane protein [Mycobacterium sp. smrl_JER01]|uniref:YwaF family protein n=1 Tax=Mycobacterium sp. smrl_JER01 TaxID=3402633 RepID=UPI003AD26AC5